MEESDISRRKYLKITAGAGVTITTAGCLNQFPDDEDDREFDENVVPQRIHDYMTDAINYDNILSNRTKGNIVSIAVGRGNDEGLGYLPAAIRVTTGTKIIWEWSGEQQREHDVTFVDVPENASTTSDLSSGEPTDEEGKRHELSLDEEGIYLYESSPHSEDGMKGAVFVVTTESDTDMNETDTNTNETENSQT